MPFLLLLEKMVLIPRDRPTVRTHSHLPGNFIFIGVFGHLEENQPSSSNVLQQLHDLVQFVGLAWLFNTEPGIKETSFTATGYFLLSFYP